MKLEDLKVGHIYKWKAAYRGDDGDHWLILRELSTDSRSVFSREGKEHRRFQWLCIYGPALHRNIIFDIPEDQASDLTLIS
jgi:hypothetical protein